MVRAMITNAQNAECEFGARVGSGSFHGTDAENAFWVGAFTRRERAATRIATPATPCGVDFSRLTAVVDLRFLVKTKWTYHDYILSSRYTKS